MIGVNGRAVLCLLLAAASATAAARCRETVAVLPLGKVASGRAEASSAEAALRRAVEAALPGCAVPREQTVAQLKAFGGRLPSCLDEACRMAWVSKLGARWVLQGGALSVGGKQTVALSLWGSAGESGRRTPQVTPDGKALEAALRELWATRSPRPGAPPKLGVLPQVTLGVGVASIGAGIAMGIWSKRTETSISAGAVGCPAQTYAACVQDRLAAGRAQAIWANSLIGAGAAVAGAGAVLLVWTWP